MKLEDLNSTIQKDQKGHIRRVDHSLEPVEMPNGGTANPQVLAARYIKELLEIERVRSSSMSPAAQDRRMKSPAGQSEAWFKESRKIKNFTLIEFDQYLDGIRVWRCGLGILLGGPSHQVLEATSTYEYGLPKIDFEAEQVAEHAANLDEQKLADILAIDSNKRRLAAIRNDIKQRKLPIREDALEADPKILIHRRQLVIYRYQPQDRQHSHGEDDHKDRNLVERALELTLPRVDDRVRPGSYCVATEVFFATTAGDVSLNWHAIIDCTTNSVLYLRALIDMVSATGYVYLADPLTTTGDPSIVPSSPTAVLNAPRTPRPLADAAVPDLRGEYVELREICPIPAAPPTNLSGKFDYNADTDEFSAVNAYFHSDGVFRMVEEMGFDMDTYFDGTSFPVPVDHRGSSRCVNAAAWGNNNSDGLGSFTFGLIEDGALVGIATDKRVVLHEFGHAILWDNVHSPNFGFAHSCGDSLAAVLCDPCSKAPDRFLTFPWIAAIPRRHDRDVSTGWAWGGVNDLGGYDSEQILSTSHFRAYRALGGDHPELCERLWAARYVTYLMIHAVGTFSPATNPTNPESWSDRLQLCDRFTDVFEGHVGGVVHKVIRWAFESQGAYQPPGAPTPVTTAGAPPKVDLYIDDGRHGEYGFTQDWCQTKEIWNRICPDGHPAHQMPIPGIENHAYVVVRNRGSKGIKRGLVRAFHRRDDACCDCCNQCSELRWPTDFEPAITRQLSTGPIGPGDYAVVGPFTWKPRPGDCLLMAAETKRDPSNLSSIAAGHSLTTERLVPFDNNIALRCMCKQCNPDYSKVIKDCYRSAKEKTG